MLHNMMHLFDAVCYNISAVAQNQRRVKKKTIMSWRFTDARCVRVFFGLSNHSRELARAIWPQNFLFDLGTVRVNAAPRRRRVTACAACGGDWPFSGVSLYRERARALATRHNKSTTGKSARSRFMYAHTVSFCSTHKHIHM